MPATPQDPPHDVPPAAGARETESDDSRTLVAMGYRQELSRRMSGFSNYAISLSIICILAGGITSLHLGLSSIGGAAIGLAWPLSALLSLAFAATMGQLASAFPTAGGLYHWGSILGGKGWGWATAWFNLAGLVTVLAAINVGTYLFVMGSLGRRLGIDSSTWSAGDQAGVQFAAVAAISLSQALINHWGIRATTRLTDLSGYLILVVSVALAASLLAYANEWAPSRLLTFTNYSGAAGGDVWPQTSNMLLLFGLSLMLPAYTITGFDASAHTSEETVSASQAAPRGMVRAVAVSAVFGWLMLAAFVLAIPDMDRAAASGPSVFFVTVDEVLPAVLALVLYAGIAVAQYLCGLATVTSASRMAYAFARDGGLPFSASLRSVSPRHRVPGAAIWTVTLASVAFAAYTPVYATITTVCVILLYLSYGIPIACGLWARGRTWVAMGPWNLGVWFVPLAVLCLAGCALFFAVGVQPPNDKALWLVLALCALLAAAWWGGERRRFPGPPPINPAAMHPEGAASAPPGDGRTQPARRPACEK